MRAIASFSIYLENFILLYIRNNIKLYIIVRNKYNIITIKQLEKNF